MVTNKLRNIEFTHTLGRLLRRDGGSNMMVVTKRPKKIQQDLKNFCDIDVTYEPVYEGIKGVHLLSIKRVFGYAPKIIGYKFKIV